MPGHQPASEPSALADGSSVFETPVRPVLIGLAHGSRHAEGTQAVEQLMRVVAGMGELDARPAFLDLTEPDLLAVTRRLVAAGHRRAVVVPLLFTLAFHATVDVPEAVAEAATETGLELLVSEILGTGIEIEEMVWASMERAGIDDASSVLLFAVGSSDAAANDAVHKLAARVASGRPGEVRAAFGTTSPRATEVLAALTEPVAVVPLFLSPGLLLEPMARLSAERGWTIAPPLNDLAAPLVLHRYEQARVGAGLR